MTNKWVMVECVSMFRIRYMVEAPQDNPELACDIVVKNEAKEFSQEYLGETIVSHRQMSEEESLALCDQDNSNYSKWSDDQKMIAFFTRDGEKVKL